MKMQQPRGVLVLLSLVILAVIVTAGLVLGTVIVRDVRQSTISDKGVTALYASETSAEEAMYHVLKLNEDPATLTTSGSLGNGSSWTRETKKTDRQFIFDFLPQNATATVDLYNLTRANQSANVESVVIDWSSGLNMRVELFEWNGTTLTSVGVQSTPACASNPCTQIVLTTPVATKAYQMLITAQGAPITDLKVNALDSGGLPVQVTTPVTVLATGSYKGAKQAIQLKLPTPAPWNGGATPPPMPVCGNGTVESGETCDDSNTTNGDGCSSTCQVEVPIVCGNGILQGSEFCDDGDATNLGICNANCTALTYCGDGTVQSPNGFAVGETCDDGNTVSWDGCHKDCRNEAPNLVWAYVSHTSSCSDAPVSLQLTDNTGDPGMALGNYGFHFVGPVCSYINFTTNATIASSASINSGASDPTKRFFYVGEDAASCTGHTLQIYDRELHLTRTANVQNPCGQINYTPGSYDPKAIANSIATQMGWSADPATYLQFDYVADATINGCCEAIVTVKLVGNAADTSMALGNYTFSFAGPVASYINFTDSQLVPTVVNSTGASDPNWRFVYISEQANMGCTPHTMVIYDRQMDSFRTANISSPCTQINYSSGSYNPKQIAANIAAANGW